MPLDRDEHWQLLFIFTFTVQRETVNPPVSQNSPSLECQLIRTSAAGKGTGGSWNPHFDFGNEVLISLR